MRWKQFVMWILAMVFATCEIAAAEGPNSSPMFQQWIVGRTKFSLVAGRVISNGNNGVWMFGIPRQQVASDGPVREQINFNGNGVTRSLTYTYQRSGVKTDQRNDPRVEFVVEVGLEGRFLLRYSDKDQPEKYFDLTQVPGQLLRLSLPGANKPRVLRASSIWHLLVINEEGCRKNFLPMLESIRPDWQVARTARAAEDELVKMAAVSRKSDRKQWDAWIHQLGDPIWNRRNLAERSLRDVGPAVLGYLTRLNMSTLDAEQKLRLHHIIRELSAQTGEDTLEHVAWMLIEDPLVWLALLSRQEESTRQAAVQQLALLLNVPITVDPKAEPASQAKAREELRTQIENIIGEGAKPDDAPPISRKKD